MTEPMTTEPRYAGFFRRLFAIFYDCFLLVAILFIAAAVAMAINQGEAIETDSSYQPLYMVIMFAICYLYFSWFWINGGQTLGMKTWLIRLQSTDKDKNIDWMTASIRFFTAIFSWGIFGLGYLWAIFDKKNRSWHDLSSKTVLIDLRRKD